MAEAAAAGVAIESLTKQLRALKQELATLDPNTAKFQELAIQAGQVKDQMNDAAEAMNANAGSAFEVLGNNAGLLTQRLGSLDFEGVAQSAKAMAGSLGKVSFKDITSGIKSMSSSFSTLGKALLTNPIFLIGTILILIITNFNKLANVIPGVAKIFSIVGDVIGYVIEKIKAFTDLIGLTEFAAQGALDKAISAKESAISKLDRQEKRQLALAKKNGENITKVEEEFAKQRIATYQKIIDASEALAKKGVELTEEQVKATKEAADAIYDIETTRIEKEAQAAEKAREEKKAKEEKEKQEAINRAKEARAKALQELKETEQRQKAVRDAIAASNEGQYQDSLSAADKELRQQKLKYDQLYKDAKGNAELQTQVVAEYEDVRSKILEKAANDEIEKTKAKLFAENEVRIAAADALYKVEQELSRAKMSELDAQKEAELEELTSAYEEKYLAALEDADVTKQLAEQQKKDIADIEEKYRKEKEDKDKEAADKEAARLQALQDFKVSSIQDSLNVITALTDVFNNGSEKSAKKAFALNKAASLAQAIVATYSAATKAYASQLVIGDPSSIVRAQIAAGIAVAGGLANVAKIAKTQFNGGGSGGGGSASGSGGGSLGGGGGSGSMTSVTPAFNPLNTSFLNNRPAQTGAVQAYVLSSNVSSAMEANQKVKDQTVL
jgi:hypothetical protein